MSSASSATPGSASARRSPKASWSNLFPLPALSWCRLDMSADLRSLAALKPGTSATVAEIRVPPESRGRLLEMGLLVGTPLELVRFAPLGDPIEIKVRGYHLTLRRHEAEQILVQPRE